MPWDKIALSIQNSSFASIAYVNRWKKEGRKTKKRRFGLLCPHFSPRFNEQLLAILHSRYFSRMYFEDERVEREVLSRRESRGRRFVGEGFPQKTSWRAHGVVEQGEMGIQRRKHKPASLTGFNQPGTAIQRRRQINERRSTIHRERTQVPVSSDDSSDDEDVLSRVSGSTRRTIHREANGILVSSDEGSDDESFMSHRSSSSSRLRSFQMKQRPVARKRTSKNPSDVQRMASPSSSSYSSSRTSTTDWSSGSNSDMSLAGALRQRRMRVQQQQLHGGYFNNHESLSRQSCISSLDSVSLGSTAHSEFSGYPNQFASQRNTQRVPLVHGQPASFPVPSQFYSSHQKTANYASTPENQQFPIQLHGVQFWDPDGTLACFAERSVMGSGFFMSFVSAYCGQWFSATTFLILTILFGGYLTTMCRLYKWRQWSGIEQQALFNEMYEIAEQVCTDTRISLLSGELKTRMVCSGEVGCAIQRNFPLLDSATKLRFWVESCVHFRLMLRSGCHHLGNGKLHPKHLKSSSLGAVTTALPMTMCSSCDNKIALEASFPNLKCD